VILDREDGGVSMDLITEVSQEISDSLDRGYYIDGRYTLEVSSAGLERPLLRPTDFSRFMGREITVRTREPIEGRRLLEGQIRSAGEEVFELELPDGRLVQMAYASVAGANLKVDWAEELRRLDGERGSLAAEG
jgi:ribosome maturation factor RimP